MDYVYYHFKTRDISETWDTAQIEQYLRGTGLFPADSFTTQNPFLSLSLLCVRDFARWNSEDYDPEKTNYIGIATTDDLYWGIRQDARIKAVFDGLEQLLHTTIQEDW